VRPPLLAWEEERLKKQKIGKRKERGGALGMRRNEAERMLVHGLKRTGPRGGGKGDNRRRRGGIERSPNLKKAEPTENGGDDLPGKHGAILPKKGKLYFERERPGTAIPGL